MLDALNRTIAILMKWESDQGATTEELKEVHGLLVHLTEDVKKTIMLREEETDNG